MNIPGSTPGGGGPDHYQVLGVAPDAESAVIKQQYRALVRQHHPDIATDKAAATRRMVLILEAWRVLSDPLERERYDRDCREKARRAAAEASASTHSTPSPGVAPSHPGARKPPAPSRPAASTTSNGQPKKSTAAKSGASWSSKEQPGAQRGRRLDKTVEAAQLSFVEGNTADAIAICKRILQKEPKHAPAAALLGDIFAQQGQRDMALLMYGRASLSQPTNPVYRWKLDSLRRATATATTATTAPTAPAASDRPQSPPSRSADPKASASAASRKTTIYITANTQLSQTNSRRAPRAGCAGPMLLGVAVAGTALSPFLMALADWIVTALP